MDDLILLGYMYSAVRPKITDEELALSFPFIRVRAQDEGIVAHEVDSHHRFGSAYVSV